MFETFNNFNVRYACCVCYLKQIPFFLTPHFSHWHTQWRTLRTYFFNFFYPFHRLIWTLSIRITARHLLPIILSLWLYTFRPNERFFLNNSYWSPSNRFPFNDILLKRSIFLQKVFNWATAWQLLLNLCWIRSTSIDLENDFRWKLTF